MLRRATQPHAAGPDARNRRQELRRGQRLHGLLLEEPTNNLDLASIVQWEQALLACQGALVVVSHDEAFLQAIGVSRRLDLLDGRLIERM